MKKHILLQTNFIYVFLPSFPIDDQNLGNLHILLQPKFIYVFLPFFSIDDQNLGDLHILPEMHN
jgi:hypothetical protein